MRCSSGAKKARALIRNGFAGAGVWDDLDDIPLHDQLDVKCQEATFKAVSGLIARKLLNVVVAKYPKIASTWVRDLRTGGRYLFD